MDYVAAHVLAVADDDPNLTSTLKLRPRSHHARLAMQWDYSVAVPRRSELAGLASGQVVTTPAGRLAHVVVPLGAIAQDLSIRSGMAKGSHGDDGDRADQGGPHGHHLALGLPLSLSPAGLAQRRADRRHHAGKGPAPDAGHQ